jgi:hypothetical protein
MKLTDLLNESIKTDSAFKAKLKLLPKMDKFLKGRKLNNYMVPLFNPKSGNIGTPMSRGGTTSAMELYKYLTAFLKNREVHRTNPELHLIDMYLDITSPYELGKLAIPVDLYDRPWAEIIRYLEKNPEHQPQFLKAVSGINVDWKNPPQDRAWQASVAASIRQQEKDRPGWSMD